MLGAAFCSTSQTGNFVFVDDLQDSLFDKNMETCEGLNIKQKIRSITRKVFVDGKTSSKHGKCLFLQMDVFTCFAVGDETVG